MKASNYILPTTKENPSDAVIASHRLMIRAGLVRKSAAGLYHYLPMGLRILKKIERIVREEMDASGALEFELPILTPAEIWQESGRWNKMGREMFRQKDRHDMDYCLGPTHEEAFTTLLKPILKSYKDLPKNVYQIHTKFRDEIRPRFGVIRCREFLMKDAYSFHVDENSLDETYQLMRKTYRKIFTRCGLKTIPVQADSGNMGGSGSEEFMVISPVGEETLSICPACGYSGNVEKTPVIYNFGEGKIEIPPFEKVHTPDKKTIKEVADFLGVQESDTIKSVLLKADEKLNTAIFIRGDREINEVKLNNFLKTSELRPLTEDECLSLGLIPGFTGPILEKKENLKVLFDWSIDKNKAYVTGGNEPDYHIKNFVVFRDLASVPNTFDFGLAVESDPCPQCNKPLKLEKGIEVGHIFKLGDKYSKAFDVKVSAQSGKTITPLMGCYGIGLNRTMATIIEQCNDENGIFWPISVAPFEFSLVSITKIDEEKRKIEEIYEYLTNNGLEVFWDERDLGPGFKFKDSELIGFPIRITLGKNFFEKKEISILNRKNKMEINLNYHTNEDLKEELLKMKTQLYKELEA
ncbi:MAG: proline--tRNA ligase [Leptospiraceae bacterium]|nr:proline--tRNA ligase [Leptospiraceae bacterium]